MTREEAITRIKDHMSVHKIYEERSVKITEALNMAISALQQPEYEAPKTYKEQLELDCDFCRRHESGDTLCESADWDNGIGFDYIRNIKYCPICGRGLLNEG